MSAEPPSDMHHDDAHMHHDNAPSGSDVPTTTGVHGMLLFGSGPVYLSHLPMFGTPHNFQVILEVTFDEATTELVSGQAEGILTFEPVEFPIVELDPRAESP